MADVSVPCTSAYAGRSEAHERVKSLASVAIGLYPVGLILLNASLLFSARKAIVSRRPTPLSLATSFLHREYDPVYFWWELMEMLRTAAARPQTLALQLAPLINGSRVLL